MLNKLLVFVCVLSFIPVFLAAQVPVIYPVTVTRDSAGNGGIFTSSNWGSEDFRVVANVIQSGSTFVYTYRVSNVTGAGLDPVLKRFGVELAPSIVIGNISNPTVTFNSILLPFTVNLGNVLGPSNNVYGFEFVLNGTSNCAINSGGCVFSFSTPFAPVWGDLSAEGTTASTTFARNLGFNSNPSIAGPFTNWIPVPGNNILVPEPGTMMILGGSLAALMMARRKKVS